MRRNLALFLTLLSLPATHAFAHGQARMAGKVLDAATKQPVEGAVVQADATKDRTVSEKFPGKKDGSYTVFLLHGTLPYKFTVSAPGYQTYVENMKLSLGETNKKDFFLAKTGTGTGTAAAAPEAKADPAVEAYNEGAQLANAGDTAGAIAKFEKAVAANPNLLAGWMALSKSSLKAKEYPKAIEAAKKVVEIDDEDTEMWAVLHQAYTATGDKANAAIAQKKLPASASSLFNEAARMINQGKDAEAEKMLKQAVEIDDAMAVAWYELGMVYVRTAKNADARAALTKYLALEPDGSNAPTAKEMLNYLK